MKKMAFLMIGIALGTGGCQTRRAERVSAPVPEVLVDRPARRDVVYAFRYPAYLEAVQTVNLVARVSGYLEKMQYVPGMPVKAGDLLFVVEPQPYRDQLQAAQAGLGSAEARLAYAKAQYERMREAMPGRAVSEIDLIQAESDYREAEADLRNAKAQLNTAKTNLDYCYIRAPFRGRVSRNQVDPQNFVNGSAQPVTLATMYRDDRLYAYFNMAYAEFSDIPPVDSLFSLQDSAMALTVADAADTNRCWYGQLDYSSPNVDLQTGTVSVRAVLENPAEELLSGMYVTVRLPYKKVEDALVVPESSIGTNQAGRYIYVVDGDNRVALRMVRVGVLSGDGMREILQGAAPDDRYVVEALMSVRPGMLVKPVSEKTNR